MDVSVFGSGGKLAVFLLWRESFRMPGEKKTFQSSVWQVVLLCQFLVLAITTRKKKLQSSVWRVVLLCQFLVLAGNRQFFCCGGKVLL